ncbi:MAG TPA: pentapeptide repeat-containing protein [Polyangiaceae bacterium]
MARSGQIRPPVLRTTLPDTDSPQLDDDADLSEIAVKNQDFADASATGVHFDTVRLTHTSLARARLARADFQDVVCTACDLSASAFDAPTFTRVELHGSTLVGARFTDGRFTDVRFVDCKIELAAFWQARFTRVTFERCKLREADFHGADLGHALFKECDLALSNWADAKLKGTDVSTSDINGIKIGTPAMVGLVVNQTQAVALAKTFGLVVV